MRKVLLLSLIFFVFTAKLQAQSCFNVAAGNDTLISCLQPCLNLKAKIPDVRTSETYTVIPIPYAPYPYTTPGGTTDPLVDADDNFSDSFKLPFPFCFYGNVYNSICVGSNGVITFDVFTNAKRPESYVINASNTIPFAGGIPNTIDIFYAPMASIYLAYYDMDPLTSPVEHKIEWRVEGTAPCRRFVVSYYHIGNYETGPCPNATNLCTMQAVLYEGTGIIDVFYENKPACIPSSNGGGISIAGVQNWNQDMAITPPLRNCTVWTAVNEGIRYVPSGAGTLLSRVELYKNDTLISNGTTLPLGNGELEATFSNICQSEDSMSYVVRAFYQQCDNPAIETEGSDTMIVYKTLNPLSINTTNVKCFGDSTGNITVTSPVGATIEYSINGATSWQTNPSFLVKAGTYTVQARVIGSSCGGSAMVTIIEPPVLTAASATMVASCANNDGTIDITPGGGTPAYEYSINSGVTYLSANIFTGLAAGTYNLRVRDANGCISSTSADVLLNDTMRLELGPDSTICFGTSLTLFPQTNDSTNIFKWTPKAGLDYDSVRNPVATPNDTTTYYLLAKWGACQRLDSVTIRVKHKPIPFAGLDTIICYKSFAILNGIARNLSGTVNYAWSPATNVIPPNFPLAIAKPDTTQQYILTVTDNYGCNFSVSDSMLVVMEPPVPAYAGNDTIAILGVSHQLSASGGASYLWSPSANLDNPFSQNPLATLFTDTYFKVKVTDFIGCIGYDEVIVKVYTGPTYYVPNAFSPNGDGQNEIFRAIPVGISQTDYFIVYNRLGETMFQTSQWLKGWDGKYKGKEAQPGTYVWIIKGKDKYGKIVEMKGTVMLVR